MPAGRYFDIDYMFGRDDITGAVDSLVKSDRSSYVCVADANVVVQAFLDPEYSKVLSESEFTVCDSGWIPIFIKWIWGVKPPQTSGSELFSTIIGMKKYRMAFLGGPSTILEALKGSLSKIDPSIADMPFIELPFCDVEDFDYKGIAEELNAYAPDIVWVSLGAPKQERFMHMLSPMLERGVLIAVGAVFGFMSGVESMERAPSWAVKCRMEFLWRWIHDPGRKGRQYARVLRNLPALLKKERSRKRSQLKK